MGTLNSESGIKATSDKKEGSEEFVSSISISLKTVQISPSQVLGSWLFSLVNSLTLSEEMARLQIQFVSNPDTSASDFRFGILIILTFLYL